MLHAALNIKPGSLRDISEPDRWSGLDVAPEEVSRAKKRGAGGYKTRKKRDGNDHLHETSFNIPSSFRALSNARPYREWYSVQF
jgi:hypothetical protein